jgi:hypothetical protein
MHRRWWIEPIRRAFRIDQMFLTHERDRFAAQFSAAIAAGIVGRSAPAKSSALAGRRCCIAAAEVRMM